LLRVLGDGAPIGSRAGSSATSRPAAKTRSGRDAGQSYTASWARRAVELAEQVIDQLERADARAA